jgi:hypothetical protein
MQRIAIRSQAFSHYQPKTIISQKAQLGTSNHPPKSDSNRGLEDPYPSMSFKETFKGISRPAKIVVIVALTIGGTMETIFWAKVLWAKFGPEVEDEDEDSKVD